MSLLVGILLFAAMLATWYWYWRVPPAGPSVAASPSEPRATEGELVAAGVRAVQPTQGTRVVEGTPDETWPVVYDAPDMRPTEWGTITGLAIELPPSDSRYHGTPIPTVASQEQRILDAVMPAIDRLFPFEDGTVSRVFEGTPMPSSAGRSPEGTASMGTDRFSFVVTDTSTQNLKTMRVIVAELVGVPGGIAVRALYEGNRRWA